MFNYIVRVTQGLNALSSDITQVEMTILPFCERRITTEIKYDNTGQSLIWVIRVNQRSTFCYFCGGQGCFRVGEGTLVLHH